MAWYDYPMDAPGGGYGHTEPLCPGCYDKPDTNIAVPPGIPITAVMPGVITSRVDLGKSAGGLSVTEKLDNPLNNLAQYISFNYLGGANVNVGQRVASGQQLGTAGSPYGIDLAIGLGDSPVWGRGDFLSGTGIPALNPETNLLDKLRGTPQNITLSTNSSNDCPWYCAFTPFANWGPCGQCSAPGDQSGQQLGTILQDIVTPSWWGRVGVILLGGIIVLVGAWKLIK